MRYSKQEKAAIAKRFRDFRKRNMITQDELAKFIGINSKCHISRIERGYHTPFPITLRRLAVLEAQEKLGNTIAARKARERKTLHG